jgi:hypothetical protein
MSRKDYILIAEALATVRPEPLNLVEKHKLEQWHRTVSAIGESLERDNPNFDADRFTAACKN